MALHWPTFFTRLGSAIVFSAIMMAGLLWNEWAFAGLALVIMVLCWREYDKITTKIFERSNNHNGFFFTILIMGIASLSSLFIFLFLKEYILLSKIALVVAMLILSSGLLQSLLQKQSSFLNFVIAGSGVVYIVLPVLMLLYLRSLSLCIPLALVLMIWMNDTMAYLVGSFIGKTPFSKISPKKTWEGTAGGAILTMLGAGVWGYYSPYYTMQDWMIIAFCVCIAGTSGDLFESKLKRMANVKDSGTLMPGHGGALDRFDSLLMATPFVFAYAYLFMKPLYLEIF